MPSSKLSTKPSTPSTINTFDDFTQAVDYSLMNTLRPDHDATEDGEDYRARQVFSGHFVPVKPTPLAKPEYVSHSRTLFKELGLSDELALDERFQSLFSGDASVAQAPMQTFGWATGYALSIYGTEYNQQCPFGTGNGYGDGRAISIFEGVFEGQRWEMQLKGGGPTPYCRGADGRAVLRSSVREFLAQDFMHALGVPTSRSLTLYVSQSETVTRPWYSEDSYAADPDILMENPVAITTRVAPSFLRVGQLELFARRTRKPSPRSLSSQNQSPQKQPSQNQSHTEAFTELTMIVAHLIEREYAQEIDQSLPFDEQVIALATHFRQRLIALVANWIRVGYCQGNFNSDNCAVGGFTLDYGPFGFCEIFDPAFQPWTGGGEHFSFFNQPIAAEANYHMFWSAVRPLLIDNEDATEKLDQIRREFADVMQQAINTMWAAKLGLTEYNAPLMKQLVALMSRSDIDYTIFFRELSHIPNDISALKKSFYVTTSAQLDEQWQAWLNQWRELIMSNGNVEAVSAKMKQTNPKYTWREWLIVPAYQQAMQGDYDLIQELQEVFSQPYEEQTPAIEEKYYRLKPKAFFKAGGVSHYSCSS